MEVLIYIRNRFPSRISDVIMMDGGWRNLGIAIIGKTFLKRFILVSKSSQVNEYLCALKINVSRLDFFHKFQEKMHHNSCTPIYQLA